LNVKLDVKRSIKLTSTQHKIMQLTFNEADFIMHCIELYTNGDARFDFMDTEGKEVILHTEQIEELFQKIQDLKSANN